MVRSSSSQCRGPDVAKGTAKLSRCARALDRPFVREMTTIAEGPSELEGPLWHADNSAIGPVSAAGGAAETA